ncbi:MAG: phosphatase PAP2 family protein [Acidimicrobiaceae bacterium]|nr:phosphatase PAP2 family protein [Acidimicrobiaceae bacterium]MXW76774.1 phosphatase PAP2 family protein [Acidimicrobiaceae bacterium]MYA75997.1 phosphatase PAP2 family protein [Acidimicrobiaceae bacterium]MYD06898.1 phosphatase PAP2 family protein [Acidimicrobiaceae bacterium]MYG56115.1 phosphatase PAP2 family protein [Acidimicrobiaceae bacterium]
MNEPTNESMSESMREFNDAIDQLDEVVDQWWEQWRNQPLVDRVFYTASEAADFSLLWHALGVAQAIIEDDPKIAIGLSAALGVESALLNGPIKSIFGRGRPLQPSPRPLNLRQPITSSFPSGHASAAMVAAAVLSRRTGGPLWYMLGAVVAASRLHVRIHHASDVLGGLVVGAVFGKIARRLLP